jgi:ABC-type Zn uptake system ZnuABC Zn-binding protein ZnuA
MYKKLISSIVILVLFLVSAGCSASTPKAAAPKETAPVVTTTAPASQADTPANAVKADTAAVTPTVTPTPPTEPAAPKVTPAPVQQKQQEQTVYITKTGAKYHRAGCRYLSKSCIPISLSDARRSYTPCSVCNPPR